MTPKGVQGSASRIRQLLPGPSPEAKFLARCQGRIRKLREKRTGMIAGRHAYAAEVLMKAKHVALKQGKDAVLARLKVMRLHARNYASLTHEEKAKYEMQALALREEKRDQLRAELEYEESRLDTMTSASSTHDTEKSMAISACQLSPQQLQGLQRVRDASLFSKKAMTQLRAQAMRCPPPVDKAEFDSLAAMALCDVKTEDSFGELGKFFCQARSILGTSVVGIDDDQDGMCWFRFVHALQNPMSLMWQTLTAVELELAVASDMTVGEWRSEQRHDHRWAWEYEEGEYIYGDIFEGIPDSKLFFLSDSRYEGPSLVVSDSALQLLVPEIQTLRDSDDFSKKGEKKTQSGRPAKKARTNTADSDTLRQISSLMTLGDGSSSLGAVQTSKSSTSSSMAWPAAAVAENEPSDVEEQPDFSETWNALDEARQAYGHLGEDLDVHFRDTLLGGVWQQARTGRPVYGIRTDVRSTSPILAFCNQFSLKRSSSFEQNVYGMDGGANLARVWKLRVHHLFLHWTLHGEPDTFPLASLEDLELPIDLASSLRSLSGQAKKRLDVIMALRPAGKKNGFFFGHLAFIFFPHSYSQEKTIPFKDPCLDLCWLVLLNEL